MLRIGLVVLAAGAVWWQLWEPFSVASLIGVIGVVVGGWPIFKEAAENIIQRRMTMELSMTIAIIAAAAIGEFFTALVITLFVLIAEVLEGLAVDRGRRAVNDLMEWLPREVSVRRAGVVQTLSVDDLVVGEAVLVNPGGRVPVDGVALAGHSFVDESRITGESMPVEKVKGARVYAGSINQSGALEVRAERIGRDTSYGQIIEIVEQADRSEAPVQRLADRLAGYLVYFALGAAAFTFLITRDVHSTIAVVIVAGACGIAAGTPLAILGGIGRAARLGAIIKGGVHLETLGRVDTVVLDKTGTLTFGEPEVRRIIPMEGVTSKEVLATAASAEVRSEHPLGRAILSFAHSEGLRVIEPEHFEYTPGRGIAARENGSSILVGNGAWMQDHEVGLPTTLGHGDEPASELFVSRDSRLLGLIVVADAVRPEAREAIERLKQLRLRVLLLTGDARPVAKKVAKDLGILEFEAELLPEKKLSRIRELISEGHIVAMIGDGVNDAPALAEASVGIAMGSGTDVALESAGVVLLGNDLVRFAEVLVLARRTQRIILQNFIGTLAIDTIGVGLAALGLLDPLLAAFIHVASEFAFIVNSARLSARSAIAP